MGACLVYAIALQNPVWGLMNSVCVCAAPAAPHVVNLKIYGTRKRN